MMKHEWKSAALEVIGNFLVGCSVRLTRVEPVNLDFRKLLSISVETFK